jgi:hypothetical protein
MTTKLGPRNSSSPHKYFTEHLAGMFKKPEQLEHKKLESFDPVTQTKPGTTCSNSITDKILLWRQNQT